MLYAVALTSVFGGASMFAQAPLDVTPQSPQPLIETLTPQFTYDGPRPATVQYTPAEAWMNTAYEGAADMQRSVSVTDVTHPHYPKDSLVALTVNRARTWITELQQRPVHGLQMDPYGALAIVAKQESLAEQEIAARLATPGLTVADRAYTLRIVVGAYANANEPTHLPIAERYLTQLDALGTEAALWQCTARFSLIAAYYQLGKSADVVRVGLRAFDLVGAIPFEYRAVFFNPGIPFIYASVVDALGGQPNGPEQIRAMNARLLATTKVPQALLAQDSSFSYVGENYRELLEGNEAMAERVGQPGAPLVANYWANRGTSHDSQTVVVNDGKIRVIEIGSFSCAPCVQAVSGLERLHQRYPGVEFNFMTAGTGMWGNRTIDPKVEADRLTKHFSDDLHATFPIGIAMPTKQVATEDDGVANVISTETWDPGHYPQPGKPTFYVLDGHGKVRRVLAGYGRDREETLATILDFLQHETAATPSHSESSPVASTRSNK